VLEEVLQASIAAIQMDLFRYRELHDDVGDAFVHPVKRGMICCVEIHCLKCPSQVRGYPQKASERGPNKCWQDAGKYAAISDGGVGMG